MSEDQSKNIDESQESAESEEGAQKSELDLAQEEAQKWKNDYLYLRAEFDNYRKNMIKERSDLTKYGAERFMHDFVEVVDNLERALLTTPTPETLTVYAQGVQLIAKEIKGVMQKHGVTSEECLGIAFDPAKHEALGTEPTAEFKPGFISRVLRAPYRIHDKLLRPAQVIVAAEPPTKK